MRQIDVHQVDAFTQKVFEGNPAGVVTNADELSDDEMGNIAREMALSETAFALSPTRSDATLRLRFFTRGASEVDFCGHATVATLFQLARMGRFGLDRVGRHTIYTETDVGLLDIGVERRSRDSISVSFVAPSTDLAEYRVQSWELADMLGIPSAVLLPRGTALVDRKLNYLYVPVESIEQLGGLRADPAVLRSSFGDQQIVVFCLFTNETFSDNADLHARGLAPLVGIEEDPFTGSMQAGMIKSAKANGMIRAELGTIVVEQGHFMGRPGSAIVTHDPKTSTVVVTGEGVHVFSTTITL
ncbi:MULTISPECIES: PhzF family phenazine biosynthesis protein [unclassified Frankia]|uniref:PhzF family phenazine biosynthesis protein n=1 Tax=unclassified Frankia TaxID=2632575 RepID=UPI002AD214A1|nr:MULTISPECIES: PhzF family phenazine biosynthesis protein [unclassified Frankia]